MRRVRLLCIVALFSLSTLVWAGNAPAVPQTREDHVKAVFLYNLARFVDWPETWTERSQYFTIGIVGNTSFGAIVDRVVAGERWRGKPMRVVLYAQPEEIDARECDVLFIDSNQLPLFEDIKDRFEGLPVLTVADTPGFLEMGGMVSLMRNQQRMEVGVNLQEVRYSGLSISSKLLRLATIVN